MAPRRSPNPDLLFEDVRAPRVERLLRGGPLPMDRATVFVTHRCNFRCGYCNGPHQAPGLGSRARRRVLARTFTPELLDRLLDDWSRHGLGHVHFTGGEATLDRHLPSYVAGARARGMLVSLTTNGSARPELYRELVASGLTEVRISVDSADPVEAERIAGVPGVLPRVLRALRELVRLREAGAGLFVIVNLTLQRFDPRAVRHTLERLLATGPDDLKLLVADETSAEIEAAASRDQVDELLSLSRRFGTFPLLEEKTRALFRRNVFGLEGPEPRHLMRRCHVPLTERTLDAEGVYPCSIYLRYLGRPLARADAPFEEQQRAIEDFVESHDCRSDPICSRHCSGCCRALNVEVGRREAEDEQGRRALERPVLRPPPSRWGLDEVRARLRQILSCEPGPAPFLVIKPQGLAHEREIRSYLADQGVEVRAARWIRDWASFARYLYLKPDRFQREADLHRHLWRGEAYRAGEGRHGILLEAPGAPMAQLQRIKRELRRWLGEERRRVQLGHDLEVVRFSPVHVPESRDLEWEARVAQWALGGTGP